jgi:hypothetical protein
MSLPQKNDYLQYLDSIRQSMPSNPTLSYFQTVLNTALDKKWQVLSDWYGGDFFVNQSGLETITDWYRFAIEVNGILFQNAPNFATFSAAVEPLVVSWLAAKVSTIPVPVP